MQCKDIPDLPILQFLISLDGKWASRYHEWDNSVTHAMPNGGELPPKLVIAKMAMLIRRGLVDGCTCGCRGDFEITTKGKELLKLEERIAAWMASEGIVPK